MKKIFTLIAVAMMAITANAQFTWDAAEYAEEDLTVAAYEKSFCDGKVTFYGHASASKGGYAAGNKTFADGATWGARFKMGGNSTFTEDAGTCVFKIEVKAGQTIKVYAVHGSSSGDDRMLYVSSKNAKDEDAIIGSLGTVAAAATPEVLSCVAPADGTYWVWEAGNVGVHAIVVESSAAIKNVNAAAAVKAVKTIENGQLVIKTANGKFNVAGAQVK